MFDTTEDKNKMSAVIDRFKDEMKKVRTGRAHPDMLASIKVEAYGQFMPLNQVANVTISDATMLVVTPFDPSTLQAVVAAIRNDQTLGLNPTDDGHVIRVPVPALTEERRKEIVKNASEKVENAKVAIRNIREDARKAIKEAKELPEDTKKRAEKEIDDLTKEFSDKVDAEFKAKSEEIMKI
ncbi:MAG: ribosome recycling factor [Candidatus Saccharibacteria bacterium]|nr:ribosome recycling factor [Candidatus Saccharibacteria bacterium]